jgi:2-polyprenyl-6-methoxyphenol hydroxylase-like FAD-dependent oxidoreductase
MRVIISGAGVAGLTLAWWLARGGCSVLIVEKASSLRDEGFLVDFFGSGYDIAERMHLLPRLLALDLGVARVSWIDKSEHEFARLHFARFRRLFDGRILTLMRGDLVRVLFEDLPDSVELRFGCEIERLDTLEDRVEVTLAGGERERGDLLIGAEGVHSPVRARLFGDESRFLRGLGFDTAAFVFNDPTLAQALNNEIKMLTVPGRQVGIYPVPGGGIASIFVHRAPSPARPANALAELRRVYGDIRWLVPTALERAVALPNIYYDQVAQIELPRWSRGRVALVGDACQAVSVLAAQGASLAMAAAYLLAQEILRQPTIEIAFDRYETRLRPAIEQKQADGRRMARWTAPTTQWRIRLRNQVINSASLPGISWFMKPMFMSALESIVSEAD